MTTEPVYIVDIIEEVVAATSAAILATIQENETTALELPSLIQKVSYHKSSFKELIVTLAQADPSDVGRFNKYPLIYLMRDFKEARGRLAGVYAEVNLRIIIIHQTESTYKITDREAKVLKPVLSPIYYEFMHQLFLHPMINVGPDEDGIPHDYWFRAYWGSVQQSDGKNALNDYVDAIEINNLALKINFPNC